MVRHLAVLPAASRRIAKAGAGAAASRPPPPPSFPFPRRRHFIISRAWRCNTGRRLRSLQQPHQRDSLFLTSPRKASYAGPHCRSRIRPGKHCAGLRQLGQNEEKTASRRERTDGGRMREIRLLPHAQNRSTVRKSPAQSAQRKQNVSPRPIREYESSS